MNLSKLFLSIFGFLLIGSSLALAGTLSLSTYYPSPTGNFDKITANNIGIGTSNPQTQLEITQGGALKLGQAYLSSGGDYVHLGNNAWFDGSNWHASSPGALLQLTGQNAIFFTHDATPTFTQRMTLNSSGNLGIGDNNPSHKLSVSGSGGSSIDLFVNGRIMTGDGTNVGGMWVNGGNTEFFGEYDSSRMGMYNGAGGWSLLMDNTGNVGLGVSSPAAKLDVADGNAIKVGAAYLSSGSGNLHLANYAWWNGSKWTLTGSGALLQFNNQDVNFYTHDTSGFTGPTLHIASNGYVGINNGSPGERLDVTGNIRSTGVLYTTHDSATYGQVYLQTWGLDSMGDIYLEPYTARNLYLTDSWKGQGALYIYFANASMDTSGDFTIAGNMSAPGYYYTSDRRLKKDIHPIVDALDKIKQLQGVDFTWKKSGQKSIGLIAQDVEKVLPQLVKTDTKGMKSVEYSNLVALLIEAVKDQQKQIDVLNKRITDLEQQQKTAK